MNKNTDINQFMQIIQNQTCVPTNPIQIHLTIPNLEGTLATHNIIIYTYEFRVIIHET